ncbi:MAG: ribonuclease H-like domain-containing protein, partial [Planctomycetota bacterium]
KCQLPDCKLQTLERHVCRRRRTGDIPGREIPSAYHDFVRSGDAWLIRGVLHHNALDLVTLLQLSMLLVPASPSGPRTRHDERQADQAK